MTEAWSTNDVSHRDLGFSWEGGEGEGGEGGGSE